MLYTEESVRAGVRVRDGKRVFFLAEGDRLTPTARDWLASEGITLISHIEKPPRTYTTLFGGTLTEKPEHMTHLAGNVLVFKDHPRIAFRGMIDALEAELLLCQRVADTEHQSELVRALQEILDFVRSLIRADVLGEPVKEVNLCGLSAAELREQSHYPAKYFGQPHFMPSYTDSPALLQLNRVRTVVRQTELACYRAFRNSDGAVERNDLILALNRLSSLCWILMIRLKAGKLH